MKKYSDEECKRFCHMAKEVNLPDFLSSNGVHLIPKGKNAFCTEEHDSLEIFREPRYSKGEAYSWRQWSQIVKNGNPLSGDNIDYLQRFEHYNWWQAVQALVEYGYGLGAMEHLARPPDIRARNTQVHIKSPVIKEAGVLPERETQNLRPLYGYLCGKPPGRCLDPEIVRECVKAGSIFLSRTPWRDGKVIHNVVFLGFDEHKKIRYAFEHGTTTGNDFKHELDWSDKSYGFCIGGSEQSDRAFLFEAPIDVLSAATMIKQKGSDWRKDPLISNSGVVDLAVERYVKEHPHIKKLCFCYDNDEPGSKAARVHMQKYAALGYEVSRALPKEGKDFNETLQAQTVNQNMNRRD